MDLNALSDFHLIAIHGSLGKASRASGRAKATLSRRIAELEQSLGVRLLERGAGGLELTEAGRLLASRTEGPMHEVADAVTAAREFVATPRGLLRISAPLLFSHLVLGSLAARFLALYPEVQLEVAAEDRLVDLVDERFDVAIRVNPRADSTLVGRCFARDRQIVTAAPTLPMPAATPDGKPIPVQAVVANAYVGETWAITGSRLVLDPQPVLRASSLLLIRDAVVAGAGAALLPQSIVWQQLERGELVQWGSCGKDVELWVLHTSRRLSSPKVRAFVDFVSEQFQSGAFAAIDQQ